MAWKATHFNSNAAAAFPVARAVEEHCSLKPMTVAKSIYTDAAGASCKSHAVEEHCFCTCKVRQRSRTA